MNFYHDDDIPDDLKRYFKPAPQIGMEATPDDHVAKLVEVFREVRRVLRADGVLWLNYGDAYAASTRGAGGSGKQDSNRGSQLADRSWSIPPGLKSKDLIGLPWALAFALRADGWWLRSDIVWHKPNPMPESVTDRPTRAHEFVFLMSKSARYFYDAEAIAEEANPANHRPSSGIRSTPPGSRPHGGPANGARSYTSRNARTVWTINPQPTPEAHFATFPEALAERCIKAGSARGDTVLDPFAGSGTTLLVAERLGRDSVGIELNPEYVAIAERRIRARDPMAPVEVAPGMTQPSLFTGDMP